MMALDPWFQNWNPPFNLVPNHHQPFHSSSYLSNVSNNLAPQRYERKKEPVTTLLPFFMQLSLLELKKTPQEPRPFETTGPFKVWYHWGELDFEYPSLDERQDAIYNQEFIPEHNLPLGVEVYKDRIFVTMPKWKPGVPATLAVLPRRPRQPSPPLKPYPNWDFHKAEDCFGVTSVFRIQTDTCGRLWVLDSGQIDITIKPKQICPPKILIFDLATDEVIYRYQLPEEFIKEDSLYSNILIDIRDNDCEDVHAYLTDVWRFGLVVFSLKLKKSWRIVDHLFFPEPLAAAYNVHGLEFEWTDGIFGLSLSPYMESRPDRLLYFHPMSSFREFWVKTSVICNETTWMTSKDAFKVMGQSRGKNGHVSASGIDRNGIMFFNMVTRDSIGCWDTRKPYKRDNLGIVAKSDETLIFPNDLRIDNEDRQSVWVLTNRLPFYLYAGLDKNRINFRIMSAYTDEAIQNTICDPKIRNFNSFVHFSGGEDCY